MNAVLHKTDQFGRGHSHLEVIFWCAGCACAHGVSVTSGGWTWNRSLDRPTFTPSILTKWSKMTPEGEAMALRGEKMPTGPDGKPGRYPSMDMTCHSFVTDGSIQYLGDCTHRLAGQTIPLEPW